MAMTSTCFEDDKNRTLPVCSEALIHGQKEELTSRESKVPHLSTSCSERKSFISPLDGAAWNFVGRSFIVLIYHLKGEQHLWPSDSLKPVSVTHTKKTCPTKAIDFARGGNTFSKEGSSSDWNLCSGFTPALLAFEYTAAPPQYSAHNLQ